MMNLSILVHRLARTATLAGLGAFALAACAVDPQDGSPTDDPIQSASEALINDGRGPNHGFSCSGSSSSCTCSKDIPGDCDNMRKNCTGGLDRLDTCLSGWFTTDCTCDYRARTTRPVERGPIRSSGDLLLSP